MLRFWQAYNFESGGVGKIEISTNGGTTYSTTTLRTITGVATKGLTGTVGRVVPDSIDLSSYIGQTNLRIRFNYIGGTTNSSWAIDDVGTPGVSVPFSYTWVDGATLNRVDTTNGNCNPAGYYYIYGYDNRWWLPGR